MRKLTRKSALAAGLLAVGYFLGASGVLSLPSSLAQVTAEPDAAPVGPSDDTLDKIKKANEALNEAMKGLQAEGLHVSGVQGINAFAITAGGVNTIQDLETGRGVDPETFAALYAGLASDEVAQHLGKDQDGRITYKNKVVRMYPISRLKRMYVERARMAGLLDE